MGADLPNDGTDGAGTEDPRLDALEARLERARNRDLPPEKQDDGGRAAGNRVIADLLGGLLGGALLGWGLDVLFGTQPGLLIGLAVLGLLAGFWNIIKRSTRRP